MSAVFEKPDYLDAIVAEIRPVGAKKTSLAYPRMALGDDQPPPKVASQGNARNDEVIDDPAAAYAADELLGF